MVRRPSIPTDLERSVKIECGHRCAIQTCCQHPVEIAHIIPWSKCRAHVFENLIGLCPTCHFRYDNGEIDRKAMQIYKLNLGFVNGRYGELEKRVLQRFRTDRTSNTFWWFLEMDILLTCLIQDGLVETSGKTKTVGGLIQNAYSLTQLGRDYIAQWPQD